MRIAVGSIICSVERRAHIAIRLVFFCLKMPIPSQNPQVQLNHLRVVFASRKKSAQRHQKAISRFW
jgi:hypothetical protein